MHLATRLPAGVDYYPGRSPTRPWAPCCVHHRVEVVQPHRARRRSSTTASQPAPGTVLLHLRDGYLGRLRRPSPPAAASSPSAPPDGGEYITDGTAFITSRGAISTTAAGAHRGAGARASGEPHGDSSSFFRVPVFTSASSSPFVNTFRGSGHCSPLVGMCVKLLLVPRGLLLLLAIDDDPFLLHHNNIVKNCRITAPRSVTSTPARNARKKSFRRSSTRAQAPF